MAQNNRWFAQKIPWKFGGDEAMRRTWFVFISLNFPFQLILIGGLLFHPGATPVKLILGLVAIFFASGILLFFAYRLANSRVPPSFGRILWEAFKCLIVVFLECSIILNVISSKPSSPSESLGIKQLIPSEIAEVSWLVAADLKWDETIGMECGEILEWLEGRGRHLAPAYHLTLINSGEHPIAIRDAYVDDVKEITEPSMVVQVCPQFGGGGVEGYTLVTSPPDETSFRWYKEKDEVVSRNSEGDPEETGDKELVKANPGYTLESQEMVAFNAEVRVAKAKIATYEGKLALSISSGGVDEKYEVKNEGKPVTWVATSAKKVVVLWGDKITCTTLVNGHHADQEHEVIMGAEQIARGECS